MPLSAQGIAARWLLLATAASTTFLHLGKADDNFTDTDTGTDFDWPNATQLLQMFEYENNTEWNSTEGDVDVDAMLDYYSVAETTIEESIRSSPDEYENNTWGNSTEGDVDVDVDAMLDNYSVAATTKIRSSPDEYENNTEGNSTEGDVDFDVDAMLENFSVGETTTEESISSSPDEYENNTEGNSTEGDIDVDAMLDNYSVAETTTEENIRSSPDDSPFEILRKHRHYARFVFMVVVLHVAVIGVCITIYSLVHCKVRTLKKRKRAEDQRILRLTNLQFQHVPNSSDCPCNGCIVAREMVQGLILQQMQELVEC